VALIKSTSYFLFVFLYLFSNRLFFIRNEVKLITLSHLFLPGNGKIFYTLSFYFTFDLWFRFSKTNLKYFRKLKKRRFFLPVLDNFHLMKHFLNYPGLKMLVGSKRMLPMYISRSGVFSPFLSLKSKKSFWKSFYWSFITLTTPFQHTMFFKINNSFLLKANLLVNLTVNLKLAIIRLTANVTWHNVIKNSMIKKLFLISRVFLNNIKISPKILNFFVLNEFNYLADTWDEGTQNKKQIFKITKFKKFQSVWDYKRPNFYIRHQRNILKKLFFIKGKNYVVSNFVQKMYRSKVSGFYAILRLELKLNFSLIRSRMCLTYTESNDFLQSGLVFINNFKCENKNYILTFKDKINFSLHLNNFINFRYTYSFLVAKQYKLNIYTSQKTILKKQNRRPPQHFSGKWIYKNMFNSLRVPKYLEVDFPSLSYSIVFMPFNLKQIFPLYWKNFKFLNIRYYNWKYLF